MLHIFPLALDKVSNYFMTSFLQCFDHLFVRSLHFERTNDLFVHSKCKVYDGRVVKFHVCVNDIVIYLVYLYKCWISRTDCSTCQIDVEANPNLKCGWCKAGTPKCVVREACSDVGAWIPYTSQCLTEPIITKVFILNYWFF